MKHFAEVGQPRTICDIELAAIWEGAYAEAGYDDCPQYTTDPNEPIDCPRCLIKAVRGDARAPAEQIAQAVLDRVARNEAAGLRYCFTCCSWEDDTDCYHGDHSRHCGHALKPMGEMAHEYRLICTHGADAIVAVTVPAGAAHRGA